jgi:hypothetical protein
LDDPEELETVHTITDRYDGPVRGIADYRGRPHYYERQFDDEADEWSDIYWLTPLDDETFALAMEAWQIWRRWETTFHQHETTMATHPALPADRPRSDELAAVLNQRLVVDGRAWAAEAKFEWTDDRVAWQLPRVRWRLLDNGERPPRQGV